jgi:hypothetical protein
LTTYSWRREIFVTPSTGFNYVWLNAIPGGQTYVRQHIRWGFTADTSFETDLNFTAANVITFGLVTTVGNGSEIPPDPRTAAGDADPPTQRWIYWETRGIYMSAMSGSKGVVAWRDTGSTEESQTKGQVLATGLPSGDTLNLFGVFSAPYPWPSDGNALVWCAVSMLTKTS